MRKNPRRKVVRYDTRPNEGSSKDIFPECTSAVLECGHILNLGVGSYHPKSMACYLCAATKR